MSFAAGTSRTLFGTGLRSGQPCRVTLHVRPGPFALRLEGDLVPLASIAVIGTDRTTSLRASGHTVAMVEHLFAACAAHGLHDGVIAEIVGGEVPLLDGGAASFVEPLGELALSPVPPRLHIARDATIRSGNSRYTFTRGDGPESRVTVRVDFDDVRILHDASWDGSARDFLRIAPARTFAFAHEVAQLVSAGQASHVDPRSVVVFAPDQVLFQGAPFTADEPARHKLLDLMGDLFLYGGPPRGQVRAFRPGHRATHDVVRIALEDGVLVQHRAVSA